MKVKTEVEVTPEEARKLLGMPEYSWLQETLVPDQTKPEYDTYNPWVEAIEWHKKFNPMFKEKT